MKRQPFLPVSSLFNTGTSLTCYKQKQFEAGDRRALLFNALGLRHKTGYFQTVETLWGHHTFPPWLSQNILFNCISEMLMSIRSLTGCFWSRPPMQHFPPGSYLERLHRREEKGEGKHFWPPTLLLGLKPTEPQNGKPSQTAAFQDHKV